MASLEHTHRISMREIAANITMHVRIRGIRTFRVRLFLATKLMMLAAWVAGFGITVDLEGDEQRPS